jgi:1-acyl-sn-glycerol-3-phosphate acyltransferase
MRMTTKRIIGKTLSSTRTAAMGVWTLGVYGLLQSHRKIAKHDEVYQVTQRWTKVWARGLVNLFGVEPIVIGQLPEPAKGPRLIVSNHRSPMDIALLLGYCGGHFLSRGDLADWPILGIAARTVDTIFVDRRDAHSGIAAIKKMRRYLGNSRTVLVFPEGTTFAGDEVRPFHAGAFTAVRGLNVELLPVGIAYRPGSEFFGETFIGYINRVAGLMSTRVVIKFGSVRFARGTHNEIASSMRQEVQQLTNDARKAYLSLSAHRPKLD